MLITEPRPLYKLVSMINGHLRKHVVDYEKVERWLEDNHPDAFVAHKTNHGTMILVTPTGVAQGMGFNVMERGTLTPYITPHLFNVALAEFTAPPAVEGE